MNAADNHKARIAEQDANMPDAMRAVMSTPKLAQTTPGPWHYDSVWSLIVGPQGGEQQIAAIHGSELVPKHEAKANAELIASAPDLLAQVAALTAKLDATRAACEAVLAFSRTYDNLLGHIPNADQTRLVRQLRAALD